MTIRDYRFQTLQFSFLLRHSLLDRQNVPVKVNVPIASIADLEFAFVCWFSLCSRGSDLTIGQQN